MIDSKHLSSALSERFGLVVSAKAEQTSEGQRITIRPHDIEYTISFQIDILLGWRTVTAIFKPGNFASSLVRSMNSATSEQKAAFAVFAGSLRAKGARISFSIDGTDVDAVSPDTWPDGWSNITISMKKVGIVLERDKGYDFAAAFPWTTGFFGMALALLPLEAVPENELAGEEEGAEIYRTVKLYERSRINRAACIEIHGTGCKVCEFSFGNTYGELGEGFIHVHHIVPVSQMGGRYILNPGSDLIPVCPNCHAMLHRKTTPYSPDELQQIVRD